jgi:hypothetical protein
MRSNFAFALVVFVAAHPVAAQIPVIQAPDSELVPPHPAEYFLERIVSPEEAVWREGQVGLALSSGAGLDGLSKLAERKDAELNKRIRELLVVGLLKTIPWTEVERRPRLAILVVNDVERGLALAKRLAAESGDDPSYVLQKKVDGKPSLLDEFRALSGSAVPAIKWLFAHELPVARGQAIVLSEYLEATICRADVEGLKNEATRVRFLQGPMMAPGTGRYPLGERAARFQSNLRPIDSLGSAIANVVNTMLKREGVNDPYTRLTQAVIQYAGRDFFDTSPRLPSAEMYTKQKAITWDEWWHAARRVWPAYREAYGVTGKAAAENQERWFQWLSRRTSRSTLTRTTNADGTSLLRVVEPPDGYVMIYHDGKLVASGYVPFETRLTHAKATTIKATAPGAKPWEMTYSPNTGKTFEIRFYKERLD